LNYSPITMESAFLTLDDRPIVHSNIQDEQQITIREEECIYPYIAMKFVFLEKKYKFWKAKGFEICIRFRKEKYCIFVSVRECNCLVKKSNKNDGIPRET